MTVREAIDRLAALDDDAKLRDRPPWPPQPDTWSGAWALDCRPSVTDAELLRGAWMTTAERDAEHARSGRRSMAARGWGDAA